MNFFLKTSSVALIKDSPWPITTSLSALLTVSGAVFFFHKHSIIMLLLSLLILAFCIFQWSRDLVREGSFTGSHTIFFQEAFKIGMILFILSEVMFFAGFFWGFFHSSTVPCIEVGLIWPPLGIQAINPFGIPLLNTVILLSSGISVTWSHHSLQSQNFSQSILSLIITCLLGWIFLKIQLGEYLNSGFSFADSIYGSIFFMATGFHGFHVFMGSILLTISGFRLFANQFSSKHHVGYEASIWYWHFVDVVWLFLFCFIYFWGY